MTERIRTCPDPEGWARRLVARSSQETSSGCTEWTGAVDRWGYGKFKVLIDGEMRQTGAHRAAWLALRGDIPGDLMPDHLCRNPPCIDVRHMELVTNQVNTIRSDHGGKSGHSGKLRDAVLHTCGQHERLDGYLYVQPSDGYTRWICRVCRRARINAYRAQQRAA